MFMLYLILKYIESIDVYRFEYVYENDFPTNLEDLGTQKPGMITKFINSVHPVHSLLEITKL